MTGKWMSRINPNSIAEMKIITAQGGFTRVLSFNTEGYDEIRENEFLSAAENPLSTFSIDVDTASYANVRRFLEAGQRPPRDAVRIEELLNYFDYDYPEPIDDVPFAVHVEIAECPWNYDHRLARIGLKGLEIDRGQTEGSNLVFLIDVSGSMRPANKLPLLKSALTMLVKRLDGRDQVAIVVYAGASGLVLPSTPGDETRKILDAIDNLASGGSTNGAAGLKLAYNVARENFIQGGVNRVILATDGDFNVGVTTHAELLAVIERDAKEGIYLTALGFGMGNYQDGRLETLTARGNGNYAYIDRLAEARKVLVEQMNGTLVTIAKDVKIQVEFNPAEVGAYRLIGYENRMLRKEDFNDDRKDAGEIGSGHMVTALYEIVPADGAELAPAVDPLKYQVPGKHSRDAGNGELLTVSLRYKKPDERTSKLVEIGVVDDNGSLAAASAEFKFAAAVAEFGLLLRDSAHKGNASFEQVQRLGLEGRDADRAGYRTEFYDLVERAKPLFD
jgi:Ca-activated chloride channel family protein